MNEKLKKAVDRVLAEDMPAYSFGSEMIALCNDFAPEEILAALPAPERGFTEAHWKQRIGDGTDLIWAPNGVATKQGVQKIIDWNKRRNP